MRAGSPGELPHLRRRRAVAGVRRRRCGIRGSQAVKSAGDDNSREPNRGVNWSSLICPGPFSLRCAHSSGWVRTSLPCARVTKVMDDPHRHRSGTAAARWRVPAYVAVLDRSGVRPPGLRHQPDGAAAARRRPTQPRMRPAPVAKTGTFEVLPANPVESPRIAVRSRMPRRTCLGIPAKQCRSRPRVRSLHPPPRSRRVPSIRCRSFPARRRPSKRSCPARPSTQGGLSSRDRKPVGQRRESRGGFTGVRDPKPPAGPVEALFSALAK